MKQAIGVCAVVLSLSLVSGCVATKQSYVAKGNKLYAAGKYEAASLNYRKAIQKDPNFGEAYYRLGLAATKQNQAQEAYDALFRAVQLLPDNIDAKEQFANVCLSFYLSKPSHPEVLYSQIKQLSDELLAKNSNSYEGLLLKGYLASTDRKSKEAIEYFRKAHGINSADPGVTTQLALLLIQDGQIQEGEKLATDLIGRQKTSYGRVYDAMYGFYLSVGRSAEAENVFKAKVDNNPKQADYIIQLARHYQRLQKPAEVKTTLQRLLDDPKDFPEGRLWVGDFYMGLRDYPEALRYYEEGVRANPKGKQRVVYQKKSMVALLAAGKRTEAARISDAILRENPKDADAERLHGDVLLDSGKPENVESALLIFQTLSSQNPNDAGLRYRMGLAYQQKGDLDSARTQFLESIGRQKDFLAARYELVEVDLAQDRPTEALQQSNEILMLRPRDRRSRILRARSLLGTGDLTTARVELAQLIKESPEDTEPTFQLGLVAIKQEKYPEAINIFDKLRSNGEPRGFAGLATAYSSQRQFDKALAVLYDGMKKWPESGLIATHLASTEALAGHYDLAIAQYQRLLAANPKSVQTHLRLGDVYLLKGAYADAITAYQRADELAPNDVIVGLTLADALARAGRTKEATARYQGIVKAFPDNLTASNNLAYLLADTGGNLDEALRLAQHALEKAPGEPGYSDTIGYIYLKKGLRDSAIRTFGNLVRKNPRYAAFHYHLGLALYENGDKTAAKKELQAALAEHPTPQDESRIKELLSKIS